MKIKLLKIISEDNMCLHLRWRVQTHNKQQSGFNATTCEIKLIQFHMKCTVWLLEDVNWLQN